MTVLLSSIAQLFVLQITVDSLSLIAARQAWGATFCYIRQLMVRLMNYCYDAPVPMRQLLLRWCAHVVQCVCQQMHRRAHTLHPSVKVQACVTTDVQVLLEGGGGVAAHEQWSAHLTQQGEWL